MINREFRLLFLITDLTNIEEHYLKNVELPNFDKENIEKEMDLIWQDIKPLYQQLHAYIRRQLRSIYGDSALPKDGSIPSYLLGMLS